MVNINRVRVVWTGVAGSPYYTSLYTLAGALTAEQAADDAEALVDACRFQVSNQVTARIEQEVAVIDAATGLIVSVEAVPGATLPMSGGSSVSSLATQGLVRLLTGQFAGGRQIRGRVSWPAVPPSAIGPNGRPTADYLSTMDSSWAAYLVLTGPAAVVWSRKNGIAVPISQATTWSEFSVLRSRRD